MHISSMLNRSLRHRPRGKGRKGGLGLGLGLASATGLEGKGEKRYFRDKSAWGRG